MRVSQSEEYLYGREFIGLAHISCVIFANLNYMIGILYADMRMGMFMKDPGKMTSFMDEG